MGASKKAQEHCSPEKSDRAFSLCLSLLLSLGIKMVVVDVRSARMQNFGDAKDEHAARVEGNENAVSRLLCV